VNEVVVRRLAEAELDEARAWYDLQAAGLGDQFLDHFLESGLAIAQGPLRWPLYHGNVRRYVMPRFPYVIYFELKGRSSGFYASCIRAKILGRSRIYFK
jgi:hypothetical protein